jgi:phosphoglycerate dehydrogenase-like enzyme
MSEPKTLLLAGRNSAMKEEFLRQALTTAWTFHTWRPDEDRAKLLDLLPLADAVVGGNIIGDWPVVERLKLYQIPFAGYNWVEPADLPRGVSFCNTYEHETPIAEYVLAALLDWRIGFCKMSAEFKAIGWDGVGAGEGPVHGEIHGETIGIVGYGRIGEEVAKRASAFGLRVIGIARTERAATPPLLDWLGVMTDLERLLGESDYVLISCPQNDETLGLIDAARFGQMKASGVIINVARGPIIDQQSLYDALAQNHIGGAIIDVWYDYPAKGEIVERPSKLPFHKLDNIRMTSHVSGWTAALQQRRWAFVAQNLDRFARGEALQNIVFEGAAD